MRTKGKDLMKEIHRFRGRYPNSGPTRLKMLAIWDRNPMRRYKDFESSLETGEGFREFHSRASGGIGEFESRVLAKTIAKALEQRLHRRLDGKSIQQNQVGPKVKGSDETLHHTWCEETKRSRA